eukprot:366336-Chlamydomonas_euryale.AAC.8
MYKTQAPCQLTLPLPYGQLPTHSCTGTWSKRQVAGHASPNLATVLLSSVPHSSISGRSRSPRNLAHKPPETLEELETCRSFPCSLRGMRECNAVLLSRCSPPSAAAIMPATPADAVHRTAGCAAIRRS